MEKQRYISRLVNIITRIFHSLDTINPTNIKVRYIGHKHFDTDELIDQYCFEFEKMNSQSLWFELLIPTNNPYPHKIDLDTFSKQVIYKYNIENIAHYISIFGSTNSDQSCHFEKDYIFEISCTSQDNMLSIVYINIDPDNFFE